MKRLMMLAALTLGAAAATPYVHPADASVSKPSEVKTGGTLRMTVAGDFDTYNPLVAQGRPNIPELTDGGGLLTVNPYEYEYIPLMAQTMSQSADKRTFTFTLRPEIKWSDGKPITADDFISSMKIYSADEEANLFSYFKDGGKPVTFKKLGNLQLSITFPRATVQNLETISYITPLPNHIFGKAFGAGGAAGVKAVRALWPINTDPSQLVVSGNFKVSSYKRGERLNLVKNPMYGEWNKDSAGKPLPYMDGLQYSIVKDSNAQLAQFLAGNVDLFSPNNRDQLAQIVAAKNSGKLNVDVLANAGPLGSVDFLYFNWNRSGNPFKQKLFRDPKFRQAMSQLVNKPQMIDQVLGGLGVPAWTSVYPLYKEWVASNVDKYKYNPAAAGKTLDALGFSKRGKDGIRVDSKGNRLSFTLVTNSENNRRQQMAQIFADEAKKAGVEVKTNFIPFNQALEIIYPTTPSARTNRQFDAAITGLNGGGFINPVGVSSIFECGGDLNGYNQAKQCIAPWEIQQLILFGKSTGEFDQVKRKAISDQIQQLQVENQGLIYLLSQNGHYVWDTRVHGQSPKAIATPLWASSYFGVRDLDLTWLSK
ncbi:ABC transporter substrate-binding protein [Deinococcus sp.]|uniref:ABC transporter substrate-binding protein n=1 Tax=Deinococcus sp. TaxID=47478 RepID=UPI003B5925F0